MNNADDVIPQQKRNTNLTQTDSTLYSTNNINTEKCWNESESISEPLKLTNSEKKLTNKKSETNLKYSKRRFIRNNPVKNSSQYDQGTMRDFEESKTKAYQKLNLNMHKLAPINNDKTKEDKSSSNDMKLSNENLDANLVW